FQRRSDFVTLGGALLEDVVAEVRSIPDYDVLILDYLSIDEFVDAGFGAGAGSAIVDFGRVVAYDPEVPAAVDVRYSVGWTRNDLVGFSRLRVADAPLTVPPIIAIALDLINLLVPVSV